MPKLTEMLPPSSFLKAEDIPVGAAVPLTIEKVSMETVKVDDGEESRPVLHFVGREKGLILNRTNLNVLVELFGDDVEKVAGQAVILYRDLVNFKGKSVPCLRLRSPESQVSPDDIPF